MKKRTRSCLLPTMVAAVVVVGLSFVEDTLLSLHYMQLHYHDDE